MSTRKRVKDLRLSDTEWLTANGSTIRTRPSKDVIVTLDRGDYEILRLLHGDVGVFIARLTASHIKGQRKSLIYNTQNKRNNGN